MADPAAVPRLQGHAARPASPAAAASPDGVPWPDGRATIRWRGDRPSTVHWDTLDHVQANHGHGSATASSSSNPPP